MSTILAIDSTTELLSISISENEKILSEIKDDKSQKHMVNIIKDIDHVLKEANKAINDIDIYGVNLGPGDFTGGRIGISVIKIFSLLSNKPIFGFNCLDIFSTGCSLKEINNMQDNIQDNIEKELNIVNQTNIIKSYEKPNHINNNINNNCSKNDINDIYIIPLKDVRNNEIYFNVYKLVSNNLSSLNFKDDSQHISKNYHNTINNVNEICDNNSNSNKAINFNNKLQSLNQLIIQFKINENKYFLFKKFNNILIKNNEIKDKLTQVIKDIINNNDDENDENINNGNIHKGNDINKNNFKNQENLNNKINKKVFKNNKATIIFTGDAIKSYKDIISKLIDDLVILNESQYVKNKNIENLGNKNIDKNSNLANKDKFGYELIDLKIDEDNIKPFSKYINLLAYYNFINNINSLPIEPIYVRDFIIFGKNKDE